MLSSNFHNIMAILVFILSLCCVHADIYTINFDIPPFSENDSISSGYGTQSGFFHTAYKLQYQNFTTYQLRAKSQYIGLAGNDGVTGNYFSTNLSTAYVEFIFESNYYADSASFVLGMYDDGQGDTMPGNYKAGFIVRNPAGAIICEQSDLYWIESGLPVTVTASPEIIDTLAYNIGSTLLFMWNGTKYLAADNLTVNVTKPFSGGDGTPADPFQISTPVDLNAVNLHLSANYVFINDIDLSGITYSKAIIAPYQGSPQPIFTGCLDGDGFSILNLTIDAATKGYIGLFGYLYTNGIVRNLNIENCNITGNDKVGSLAGYNSGSDISNCYATGTVTGGNLSTGGLVGDNYSGSITDCYALTNVHGIDHVGGLVGSNSAISIMNSYAGGTVNGEDRVGGLVGYNRYSTVNSCYANGSVTGSLNDIGGLVGYNEHGTIINSYAMGATNGTDKVGGLIGYVYDSYSRIINCYATGAPTGSSNIGGLIGYNVHIGTTVIHSFWDTETSNISQSAGGTDKTTAQMQTRDTYVSSGWDFAGENANGIHHIWQFPTGGGYPNLTRLDSNFTPVALSGAGTTGSPYMISNAEQLGAIWDYSGQAHFELTSNIDLTGISLTMPVIPYFKGSFNGNGHTVSNLSIIGGDHLGFFGTVLRDSLITNLALEGISIDGVYNVGGLGGLNSGNISNCHTRGTITGRDNSVGGLFGSSSKTGIITDCYTSGTVIGYKDSVGGLLGGTLSYISNSYSTADVTGSGQEVGGLVGYSNSCSISNCYTSGIIKGDNEDVGGLIGQAYSTIIMDCSATGPVTGHRHTGGLVGYIYNSGCSILDSHAIGDVSCVKGYYAGGLVGLNSGGQINNCYAKGLVDSNDDYVGGFVGCNGNSGSINDCYATGSVIGEWYVGGFVGKNSTGTSLEDCYATGAVDATVKYTGGFVGWNDGTINNCYSTGTATAEYGSIGGFVPYNRGSITSSFWDVNTSEIGNTGDDNCGATGKTTAEMMTQVTFANWDFEPDDGDPADWMMLRENEDYPRLDWQEIYGGDIAGLYGADMVDFACLANYWGLNDCNGIDDCGRADIDSSGDVGISDMVIIAYDWLKK